MSDTNKKEEKHSTPNLSFSPYDIPTQSSGNQPQGNIYDFGGGGQQQQPVLSNKYSHMIEGNGSTAVNQDNVPFSTDFRGIPPPVQNPQQQQQGFQPAQNQFQQQQQQQHQQFGGGQMPPQGAPPMYQQAPIQQNHSQGFQYTSQQPQMVNNHNGQQAHIIQTEQRKPFQIQPPPVQNVVTPPQQNSHPQQQVQPNPYQNQFQQKINTAFQQQQQQPQPTQMPQQHQPQQMMAQQQHPQYQQPPSPQMQMQQQQFYQEAPTRLMTEKQREKQLTEILYNHPELLNESETSKLQRKKYLFYGGVAYMFFTPAYTAYLFKTFGHDKKAFPKLRTRIIIMPLLSCLMLGISGSNLAGTYNSLSKKYLGSLTDQQIYNFEGNYAQQKQSQFQSMLQQNQNQQNPNFNNNQNGYQQYQQQQPMGVPQQQNSPNNYQEQLMAELDQMLSQPIPTPESQGIQNTGSGENSMVGLNGYQVLQPPKMEDMEKTNHKDKI